MFLVIAVEDNFVDVVGVQGQWNGDEIWILEEVGGGRGFLIAD